MSNSQKLFQDLSSLKHQNASTESAESRLIAYCTNILGSVERYHFDYKEKKNRQNSSLEDDDKKNLAKAVSGFANSGGGTLIWGIQDKNLSQNPFPMFRNFYPI